MATWRGSVVVSYEATVEEIEVEATTEEEARRKMLREADPDTLDAEETDRYVDEIEMIDEPILNEDGEPEPEPEDKHMRALGMPELPGIAA